MEEGCLVCCSAANSIPTVYYYGFLAAKLCICLHLVVFGWRTVTEFQVSAKWVIASRTL